MTKDLMLILLSLVFSSCGHMLGPLFYEKNYCGPYNKSELNEEQFKSRADEIITLSNEATSKCKFISSFHCWDYVGYQLKDYDLRYVAKEFGGNAIKVVKKWEEDDDFKKGISYHHYSGEVLKCKE